MCPLTAPDRDDFPGLVDEPVPGVAAQGDDLRVGLENAIGEPVVSDELPDVLDRVEFGGAGRQGQDGHVVRHGQFVGGVPSSLVEHENGMGARRHLGCDFVQMPLHGLGVAAGQDEGGADAAIGTDGAEDVSRLGALIVRRRGPRSPSCPAPGDLVLLPDPGLVPEPDLYPVAIDPLVARDRIQALGERFLKASTAPAAWA